MRLLLDTHILLWWLKDDRKLTKETERYITDTNNTIYVSTVSTWEVAIKQSIGRLTIDLKEFEEAIGGSGMTVLPITLAHTLTVSKLPMHHSDPFDRLLIAQSIVDPVYLFIYFQIILM